METIEITVKGKPGTGKTLLIQQIAYALDHLGCKSITAFQEPHLKQPIVTRGQMVPIALLADCVSKARIHFIEISEEPSSAQG